MYLNDAQRDLICSAWNEVTEFTSTTNTKERHVLRDTTHEYKEAQKNVWVEIAQNVNAEVAQMNCRMQLLLVSGSVKKNS
jgi:glutaredoxin-related protein